MKIIFGKINFITFSFLQNKNRVDIAVNIDGAMGFNFIAMADEIEAILGIKTDVIPMRSIKPECLPSIEKDIIYV